MSVLISRFLYLCSVHVCTRVCSVRYLTHGRSRICFGCYRTVVYCLLQWHPSTKRYWACSVPSMYNPPRPNIACCREMETMLGLFELRPGSHLLLLVLFLLPLKSLSFPHIQCILLKSQLLKWTWRFSRAGHAGCLGSGRMASSTGLSWPFYVCRFTVLSTDTEGGGFVTKQTAFMRRTFIFPLFSVIWSKPGSERDDWCVQLDWMNSCQRWSWFWQWACPEALWAEQFLLALFWEVAETGGAPRMLLLGPYLGTLGTEQLAHSLSLYLNLF